MKPKRLPVLVKPLLHAVLLKVHPDFFVHQPAAKAANHRSVQRLQDLMAPVLSDSAAFESPNQSRELTHKPLEFVSRSQPTTTTTTTTTTTKPIAFTFSRQPAHSIAQLQAQRTHDLLRLCGVLGIETHEDTVIEIKKVIGHADQQTPKASAIEALIKLRMARAREARENYARKTPGIDPLAALRSELRNANWSPHLDAAKSGRLELNRRNIFFAANVAPQKYESIIRRIESQLISLEYSRWCTLPVMVVANWRDAGRGGVCRYPGFVTIPETFKTSDLKQYFESNIDGIKEERNKRNAQYQR